LATINAVEQASRNQINVAPQQLGVLSNFIPVQYLQQFANKLTTQVTGTARTMVTQTPTTPSNPAQRTGNITQTPTTSERLYGGHTEAYWRTQPAIVTINGRQQANAFY